MITGRNGFLEAKESWTKANPWFEHHSTQAYTHITQAMWHPWIPVSAVLDEITDNAEASF